MIQFGQKLALDDSTNFNFWWETFNWSAIFIETIDTLSRWSYLRIIEVDTCAKRTKTLLSLQYMFTSLSLSSIQHIHKQP